MMRALFTAATGMHAQKLNVDVISNNLANVNTAGFKRSRVDFQDLFYQTIRAPGVPAGDGAQIPTGIQVGLGVRPAAVQKLFTQGDFMQTDNSLDLVINGAGFFQIARPDGTIAYTRAGAFKIDMDGRIVTSEGHPIDPEITIPEGATQIAVSFNGIVTVLEDGDVVPVEIGQLELARFINPGGLKAIGKNLFLATEASGDPVTGDPGDEGRGFLQQGFLEKSNVNVVEELANLIVAQRAFELNSRALQAADEMLQTAGALRR